MGTTMPSPKRKCHFRCLILPLLFSSGWHNCGRPTERADPGCARHLHKGHPRGQAGDAKRLSVPRVQDQTARANLRLDIQPEDQREPLQVDTGWSGLAAADLVVYSNQKTAQTRTL